MSEAHALADAHVVALPTAAQAKVRQPEYHARHMARRRGFREGTLEPFLDQYVAPALRKAVAAEQAETAKRDALYAEGGLHRGSTLLLLTVLFAASPEEARTQALALLTVAHMGKPSPETLAALTFAKSLHEAASPRTAPGA